MLYNILPPFTLLLLRLLPVDVILVYAEKLKDVEVLYLGVTDSPVPCYVGKDI